MAESVVSFIAGQLGNLLLQEASFLYGASEQVQEMQTELVRMKSFLKEADKRQAEDERVRNWVLEIQDGAYDAEDAIETFILEVAARRRGGIGNTLKRYACICVELVQLHKVRSDIQAVKNRISGLTASLQTYGIAPTGEGEGSISTYERQRQVRRSYSHLTYEEDSIGLEEDVETLVKQLVSEEKHCQVVSICGMGGLGKTTLAKKVYHHSDIRRHFSCCAWSYVSQQCRPRDIFQGILIKLTSPSKEQREEIEKMRDEELVRKLYKVQQERVCLVILDDIWSTQAWNSLSPAFPLGRANSKILLTTRKKEVAEIALHVDSNGFLHQPRLLNAKESWELLQNKAFSGKGCPDARMESLGQEMVRHCGGLPMAIIALGGLLATKPTFNEWETVNRNIISYIRGKGREEEHDGVLDILALSYYDLPHYLKPCFFYLGHFPEDFEISAKRLIRMWIAEGIISRPWVQHHRTGEATLEDVAENCLVQLVERCIVQVGEWGSTGRIRTCQLHDLMRDLCLSKAKEENFLKIVHVGDDNNGPLDDPSSIPSTPISAGKIRRLAIHLGLRYQGFDEGFWDRQNAHLLRALLLFKKQERLEELQAESMWGNFKLLRVLEVGNCVEIKKLPKAIGNLIHLRYFSLRGSYVEELPSSVGKLGYMQTLDLSTQGRTEVPNVIRKMKRLKHLVLPWNMSNSSDKLRLNGLSDLETLSNFDDETCDIEDLRELSKLRKLHARLQELEQILSPRMLNNLMHLRLSLPLNGTFKERDLKELLLSSNHLNKLWLEGQIEKLPENDQFLPNLIKLELRSSCLEEDPMPTLETLPSLAVLKLSYGAFIGREMVCSAKGFPQLKSLEIFGLRDLEAWSVEKGAMPRLARLMILSCRKLGMVPEGLKYINTLRELTIRDMPAAFAERLMSKVGGEDFYKVRHVSSVVLEDCYS